MSINFPTAFWKNQKKVAEEEAVTISWDTNLYYMPNTTDPDGLGITKATTTSAYDATPFWQNPDDEVFYPYYNASVTAVDSAGAAIDYAYFGWYRNGNSTYDQTLDVSGGGSVALHRSDPWIINQAGTEIDIFAEADRTTLSYIDDYLYTTAMAGAIQYAGRYYNGFIQSGYAKGTFTLESPKTLNILASGLGEKYVGDDATQEDETFDRFQLYVKEGTNTKSLICTARNPHNDASRPWDVDHLKFKDAGGSDTPPFYNRDNRNTSIDKYIENDDGNGSIQDGSFSNVVEQTERKLYVREAARFTGSKNLAAGTHEIEFYFNTNDGNYNSGVFVGATFSFS